MRENEKERERERDLVGMEMEGGECYGGGGDERRGGGKTRVRGLADRLAELTTPRPTLDVDQYAEEDAGIDAGVAYRRNVDGVELGDFGDDDDVDDDDDDFGGAYGGGYLDGDEEADGMTRRSAAKGGAGDAKKRQKKAATAATATMAAAARVNGESRLRLRASIALEDGAYQGQTSSRAHVFAKLPSTAGVTTSGGEEEEEEEDDDDDANAAAAALRNQFEDDDQEEEEEEEEDINEEERELRALEAELRDDGNKSTSAYTSSAGTGVHNVDDADDYNDGSGDENGDAVVALRGIHERARSRARRVREQCALWEKSLGLRIRLQRAVVPGANKLPVGDAHANACSSSGRVSDAFSALGRSAAQLLVDLLDCQQHMLAACGGDVNAKSEAIKTERERRRSQDQGKGKKKRKHQMMTSNDDDDDDDDKDREGDEEEDEDIDMEETPAFGSRFCWDYLERAHAETKAYADAALDEWQKKALIATGGAAAAASAMKLQSFVGKRFSDQVASYIDASEAKLRKKLHLTNGEAPRRIGARDDDDANESGDEGRANDADEREMEEAQKSHAEALDYETFDDTDFYAQLLHEFLDSKGLRRAGAENGTVVGGVNVAKRRKKVDRNASKGRKLRFHVMEKLVNFMAPVECSRPVFAEQLFSNLFGGGR